MEDAAGGARSGREHHRDDPPLSGWDKPDLDLSGADWRSGSQGAGDVRIAFVEGFVALRNSRRPGNPALVFGPAELRAFVLNAREGEFDLT